MTAAMRAALDQDRWLCDRHEPQWLAPPYQWALVLDSLRARHRRDPDAGPDPRTAEWEAAYGSLPSYRYFKLCEAQAVVEWIESVVPRPGHDLFEVLRIAGLGKVARCYEDWLR